MVCSHTLKDTCIINIKYTLLTHTNAYIAAYYSHSCINVAADHSLTLMYKLLSILRLSIPHAHAHSGVVLLKEGMKSRMDGTLKKLSDLHLNCLPGLHCALVWGDVHRLLVDPNRPLAGPPNKALDSFKEDEQLVKWRNLSQTWRADSLMVDMVESMEVKIAKRVEELNSEALARYWEVWVSRIGASIQYAEDFSNELLELELNETVSLTLCLSIYSHTCPHAHMTCHTCYHAHLLAVALSYT